MKRLLLVVVLVLLAVSTPSHAAGQATDDRRSATERLVQSWLASSEPVHLSADATTLIGDRLRLEGSVRIRFADGQFVLADEAVIDRGAGRVTLIGNVRAHLRGGGSPPRIDFR